MNSTNPNEKEAVGQGKSSEGEQGKNSIWDDLKKQKENSKLQMHRSERYELKYNMLMNGALRSMSNSQLQKELDRSTKESQKILLKSKIRTPKDFVRATDSFSFKEFNPKLEFLDELGLSQVRMGEPDKQSGEMLLEGRMPLSSSIKSVTRVFSGDGASMLDLPFIKLKIKAADDVKPRIIVARNKKLLNVIDVSEFDIIAQQSKEGGKLQMIMEGHAVLKLGIDRIRLKCHQQLDNETSYVEFENDRSEPWCRPFGIETLQMNEIKMRISLSNPPRLEIEGNVTLDKAINPDQPEEREGISYLKKKDSTTNLRKSRVMEVRKASSDALIESAEVIMDDTNPHHALITFIHEDFSLHRLFVSLKVEGIAGSVKKILESSQVSKAVFNIAPQAGVKIRGRNIAGGMESELQFKFIGVSGVGRMRVHKAHVSFEAMLGRINVPGVLQFSNKDVLLEGPKLSIKMIPADTDQQPGYVPEIRLDGQLTIPDFSGASFEAVGQVLNDGLVFRAGNVTLDKKGIFRCNVKVSMGEYIGQVEANKPIKAQAIITQQFEKFVKPTTEKLKALANQGYEPCAKEKVDYQKKLQEVETERKKMEKMVLVQNQEIEGFGRKLKIDSISRQVNIKEAKQEAQLQLLENLKGFKMHQIEMASLEKKKLLEESQKRIKEWKELLEFGQDKAEKDFKSFTASANQNLQKADGELLKMKSIIKDRKEAPWYDDKKKKELAEIYPEYLNSRAEGMEFKQAILQQIYEARLVYLENAQILDAQYQKSVKEEKQILNKKLFEIQLQLKNDLMEEQKQVKEAIDDIFQREKIERDQLKLEIKDNSEYVQITRKGQMEEKRTEYKQLQQDLKEMEKKYLKTYQDCSVNVKILQNWKALQILSIHIETLLGQRKGIEFIVKLIFLGRLQKEGPRTSLNTKTEELYAVNREIQEYQFKFEKFPSLEDLSCRLGEVIYEQMVNDAQKESAPIQ